MKPEEKEIRCSLLGEEIDIGEDCTDCVYYEAMDPVKNEWLCNSAEVAKSSDKVINESGRD